MYDTFLAVRFTTRGDPCKKAVPHSAVVRVREQPMFPPPAQWNATNMNDVTETFICSAMIIPSAVLAQCLPLLVHWGVGRDHPLRTPATTAAEMAGWAGPVIATFASPNIESTWLIVVVCFALAVSAALCVASQASPARMDGVRFQVWSSGRSQPLTATSITYTRISSLLFTALGIFCVDFPNYGERFMKTDTVGLTLMDIGIGCSLFSSGLSEGLRLRPKGIASRILWNSLPLLVIGVFRTMILQAIGYRVEVTEYGQHWNAFITFAAMPLFLGLVERIPSRRPWLVGAVALVLILVPYNRWLLQHTEYFMHEENRRNVFEANREGIASVLGFFGIFLGGRLYAQLSDLSDDVAWSTVIRDQSISLLLCIAAVLLDQGLMPMIAVQAFSRRICNAPYVLFCIGMNAFLVRGCIGFNRQFLPTLWKMRSDPSPVGNAPLGGYTFQVNAHQLLYFVFANIVTGLINLKWDTHAFSDVESYFVQAAYVLILGIIILLVPDVFSTTKIVRGAVKEKQ